MKQKEILLFGATGQIGKNLVRKLSKNNYRITVVTRNIHQAGYILKTQANFGYLNLVELKNFNLKKMDELIKNCSVCVNLIGILYEKKKYQFKTLHTDLPDLISQKAKKYNISKFIHLSALGIDEAVDSNYAKSKLQGEMKIKSNFNKYVIIRPSIVYSVDDKFSTNFMSLLSKLPIMPLYYNGETKFSPIHVTELVDIIYDMIENKKENLILECVGPEELTFKEILQKLLISIKKKRVLLPIPFPLAKLSAKFLQILPNPLLTEDQLRLLKYHNCKSGKHKNNFDLGYKTNKRFEIEIEKYSYNWTTGGQFAKTKNTKEI